MKRNFVRVILQLMFSAENFHSLGKILSRHRNKIFLILTIAVGLFVLYPTNNVELFLQHGDHGKDLYAFKKTSEGALPYRDYYWNYGPLMPYYYAFFLKVFSVSIQSVLLGQNVLILLSGIFVFFICCVFFPPGISFVCALWFWAFQGEFFYTYNHNGAILALLSIIFFLFKYLKKPSMTYIYSASAGLLILLLIRPNMGLVSILASFISLLCIDHKKYKVRLCGSIQKFAGSFLIVIIISVVIYWILLGGLPNYYILQCLSYTGIQKSDYTTPTFRLDNLIFLYHFILHNFTGTLLRKIFTALLVLSFARLIAQFFRKQSGKDNKNNTLLIFIVLSSFCVLTLHEIIMDANIFRINWSLPVFLIIIFFVIHKGTQGLPLPALRNIIFIALFIISYSKIVDQHNTIASIKRKENLLHIDRTRIYIDNQQEWIKTVSDVSRSIKRIVPRDENIFVVPYGSIYYFLTDHDAAVPESMFFVHLHFPAIHEKNIVQRLVAQNNQYIIYLNTAAFYDPRHGFFGKTHCPIISKFIQDNYKEIETFGDWKKAPGWIENHAVKILAKVK